MNSIAIVIILIAIVVIAIFWFIFSYNRFVGLTTKMKQAWSDIDVQLKRRYDLIPNLVATVKGYASHEKESFENVTRARAAALGAQSVGEKAQAENQIEGALKTIFALAENYPELKANQNFLALQNELSDTENKIQASRRYYNGNVRDLNTAIAVFPSNIVAKIFGFTGGEFFDLDAAEAREPVEVKF
jgi:LemA protein